MTKSRSRAPIFARRDGPAFVLEDPASRDAVSSIAHGALVTIEIKQPRNLKQLRLYWALCSHVGDALGHSSQVISDVIKLKTGHVTVVRMAAGGIVQIPASIAASKLSPARFSAFLDEACRVVCELFLPHMEADALRDEVLRMVGVNQG